MVLWYVVPYLGYFWTFFGGQLAKILFFVRDSTDSPYDKKSYHVHNIRFTTSDVPEHYSTHSCESAEYASNVLSILLFEQSSLDTILRPSDCADRRRKRSWGIKKNTPKKVDEEEEFWVSSKTLHFDKATVSINNKAWAAAYNLELTSHF